MQTTGNIRIEPSRHAYYQRSKSRREPWRDLKKEDRTAIGCCNDFLTASIAPIAHKEIEYEGDNVVTEENYDFLLRSASNYAKLLGRRFKHTPGRDLGESLYNLYQEFSKLVSPLHVNLTVCNGNLSFELYQGHEWIDFTFFFFPVKFIENLDMPLRNIAVAFVHELLKSNGLIHSFDNYDTQNIIDFLLEEIEQGDADDDQRKINMDLYQSYTKGEARELINEICDSSYYSDLASVLNYYIPKNRKERKLVKLFKDGMQFIGEDKPSIVSYGYDPEFDIDGYSQAIDIDRIIRVIYDADDYVSDQLMEYLNTELQESRDTSPYTVMILSPKTNQLFCKDDYPERFCKWFLKTVREL